MKIFNIENLINRQKKYLLFVSFLFLFLSLIIIILKAHFSIIILFIFITINLFLISILNIFEKKGKANNLSYKILKYLSLILFISLIIYAFIIILILK